MGLCFFSGFLKSRPKLEDFCQELEMVKAAATVLGASYYNSEWERMQQETVSL